MDQGERVVHNASPGYILVQGPDGLPMAVPVQGNATGSTLQGSPLKAQKDQPQMMLMPFSGKVAHDPQAGSAGLVAGQQSTLETQGLYPQLKPMPTSGEVGGEPQFVPTADTSGGIVTGCQPQQNGMGWSYLEENQVRLTGCWQFGQSSSRYKLALPQTRTKQFRCFLTQF